MPEVYTQLKNILPGLKNIISLHIGPGDGQRVF